MPIANRDSVFQRYALFGITLIGILLESRIATDCSATVLISRLHCYFKSVSSSPLNTSTGIFERSLSQRETTIKRLSKNGQSIRAITRIFDYRCNNKSNFMSREKREKEVQSKQSSFEDWYRESVAARAREWSIRMKSPGSRVDQRISRSKCDARRGVSVQIKIMVDISRTTANTTGIGLPWGSSVRIEEWEKHPSLFVCSYWKATGRGRQSSPSIFESLGGISGHKEN